MNALITGATGFLGSRIVERLVENTSIHRIIATGRKFSSDNRVVHKKVTYILGDLEEPSFVQQLFAHNIHVVINCASLSSPWGSKELFLKANITTQKNLLYECQKAQVQRFIYISSPSIYFDFKDALNINEETPLPKRMVNQYAQTKHQAEKLLIKSSLPYVILRPRALIGRGDTVIMPRLIRSYQEGKLRIIGNGKNRVDLTSVSNMTEAVNLAIFTSNYNETYNISNGEPVNLWHSINHVLKAIDLPPVEKKMPYSILYLVALLMEFRSKFFSGKEPTLTRYSVGVLAKSFTFDIQKAKNKLMYHPLQSTKEAIEEFAKWYKNEGHDKG